MISNIVPHAKLSPRIENGVIYAVEGDTFTLTFEMDMYDGDDEPVVIDGGTFYFKILSEREETCFSSTISEFVQPEEGDLPNAVFLPISITAETAALMPKGKYHYTIRYDSGNPVQKMTMLYRNLWIVE